jgi:hypothetical protein
MGSFMMLEMSLSYLMFDLRDKKKNEFIQSHVWLEG